MKFKRGENRQKLPERIDTNSAQFAIYSNGDPEKHPESHLIMLPRVGLLTVEQRPTLGCPSVFAISHADDADYIVLWPSPDQEYVGRLQYHPAMKEI